MSTSEEFNIPSTLPILPQTSQHVTQHHTSPDPLATSDNPTPVSVHRATPPLPAHRLTTRQLNAIPLILDGLSDSAVASRVGVTRESVNRWRNTHPAFIAELNRQRHFQHTTLNDRYNALLTQAMEIFQRYQSADIFLESKLKAATTLLRFAPRRLFSAPPLTPSEPTNPEDILTQLLSQGFSPSPDDSPTDDAPPPPPPPPPTKKSRR